MSLTASGGVSGSYHSAHRAARALRQERSPNLPKTNVRNLRIARHEAEHRILNSLQLVACLLRDSLRHSSCDEARQEITAAHDRILSVASLQRALFIEDGHVPLATHLDAIARNLGQTLIAKDRHLTITVACPEINLDATTATSLGLIVSELVINAIKHAFPDNAAGTITVSFTSDGSGWHLSVADDGIGRGTHPATGAGSGIVAALAVQLDARLVTRSGTGGFRTDLTGSTRRTPTCGTHLR